MPDPELASRPGELSAAERIRRLVEDPRPPDRELFSELTICRELEGSLEEPPSERRDLPAHCRPKDLRTTGWGVVFHPQDEPLLRRSLGALLARRKLQAGALYKEVRASPETPPRRLLWANESPGTIDPRHLPYYLLIFGGPERVSFSLQALLSLNHAVGRIAFDDPADYSRYQSSVLAAERGYRPRGASGARATVFSVQNQDQATELLTEYLVPPVVDVLRQRSEGWEVDLRSGDRAKKADLAEVLHEQLPDFLVLSCHGKAFHPGSKAQEKRQGALICGDWIRREPDGPGASESEYLHGGDIAPEASFHGLVAFCFACFGAGTPLEDHYPHKTQGVGGDRPVMPDGLAVKPFVAHLPQVLLARGALGFLGHLDRGWTYSCLWHLAEGRQAWDATASLRDALGLALDGFPIGHALRPLHRRRSTLAAQLLDELERLIRRESVDPDELTELWTAHNDARNFLWLGDPAVVLPAARNRESEATDDVPFLPSSPETSDNETNQPIAPAAELPDRDAPQPQEELELGLRVESRQGSDHRLGFLLELRSASLRKTWPFESGPLHRDPFATFRATLLEVESLSGRDRTDFDPLHRLRGEGTELFTEVFPEGLQRRLRDLARRPGKKWLEIHSDLWAPWELLWIPDVHPTDAGTGGQFLAEAFLVTRRLQESVYPATLPLTHVALVIPSDSRLRETGPEKQDLERLLHDAGRRADSVPARHRTLVRQLATVPFDGWHFSGHGLAPGQDPARWSLLLEEGETLTSADLPAAGAWTDRGAPLVFLNACHGSLQGSSLSRPGGLAARFLRAGAGAVVGASWAVDDGAARRFAVAFYRRFLRGTPLAEAVHEARLEIRDSSGADASWLAFTVFGHPRATCRPRVETAEPPTRPEDAGETPAAPVAPKRRAEPPQPSRWQRRLLGLLLALLGALGTLRTETRVDLDLLVDRAVFEVAEKASVPLMSSVLGFSTLTIDRYQRLTLPQEPREESLILDAESYGTVTLEPASYDEATLSVPLGSLGFGSLEPGTRVDLRAQPAGRPWVDLTVDLAPYTHPDLSLDQPFRVQTDQPLPDHAAHPPGSSSPVRELPTGQRFAELVGGDRGLSVTATVRPGSQPLLASREVPISSLEFQDLAGGERRSTLQGSSRLLYPGAFERPAARLEAGEALYLGHLRSFRLTHLALDPETGFLRLRAAGFAGEIHSGRPGLGSDRRLRHWQRWLPGSAWLWALLCLVPGAWLLLARPKH